MLHASQTPSIENRPAPQLERQRPPSSVTPGGHDRQLLLPGPAQEAQEESQSTQLEDASAYLDEGQAETHDPASASGVLPSSGHAMHDAECESEHSAQLGWQASQLAPTLLTTTYVCAGHAIWHVLLSKKGRSSPQLRHWSAAGPEHVLHSDAHGWQVKLPSAAQPVVHEFTHSPAAVEKGNASLHDVQSVARGPEHVRHDSKHEAHASDEFLLPPAQVKPVSTSQSTLQPSPEMALPSSQLSLPTRTPSPQMLKHASKLVNPPPSHW